MASDVSLNAALTQQNRTSATGARLAEDFDSFLTLLTTQLQNQDPLSPLDTNQFTQQLVSFAGVEQQINANQKLDSLVQMQLSNAFSASLGYVGLDVRYLSNELAYAGTGSTKISYSLEASARTARMNIYDDSGSLVYSATVAPEQGPHDITWDGKSTGGQQMKAGTYTIKIDALDAKGTPVKSTTVVPGRVKGVETQSGLIHLLVGDRAVPLANVLNASLPAEEKQASATTPTLQ